MLVLGLAGVVLAPIYCLLAAVQRAPGLEFRVDCVGFALRLLLRTKPTVSLREIYKLLVWPMDSTRYVEFDFMWRTISEAPIRRYLDVSSPRLFPIILLGRKGAVTAEFVNPDAKDLARTADLVDALGLSERCHLHCCVVESAPFAAETFDVVTSISVVEHIPEDTEAVKRMWEVLRPGGSLLLSVPCAAEASEQYVDRYEYGVLKPDQDGFTFFQRFYDWHLLQQRFFCVTGEPWRCEVYGEKTAGAFQRYEERKWTDWKFPYWREPYMMGREYGYFPTIADLPGEGVIGMAFVKR